MKRRRHSTQGANHFITAIGGAAMLGLTYLALRTVPELVRYLRIRRM